MTTHIGMLLFPRLTQLDLTGPYEVFARMPDTRVHLVAHSLETVVSDYGLAIVPDTTFDDCPPLDVLFVPGGFGISDAIESRQTLAFLQQRAPAAKYVTSVCTGALVLGAAGLLVGYRATTHWLSLDLLPIVGAIPVSERIVIDRNRITGAGVTAGIDFGLAVAAQLFGADVARSIQLMLEYDPAPPFDSGSPRTASAALVSRITERCQKLQQDRKRLLTAAVARPA
ncbi:MAG: DJ-1/PfpI family protein [Bryobacteraceae bacterium]